METDTPRLINVKALAIQVDAISLVLRDALRDIDTCHTRLDIQLGRIQDLEAQVNKN